MWNSKYAALWSILSDDHDRRSHHPQTKQRAQEEQGSWAWEESQDILDVGRNHGRRQKPAMDAGGGSDGATTTAPGFAATTEAREAASGACPQFNAT